MSKCTKCGKEEEPLESPHGWCWECGRKSEEIPVANCCEEVAAEGLKRKLPVKLDLGNNVIYIDSLDEVEMIRVYEIDEGYEQGWRISIVLKSGKIFPLAKMPPSKETYTEVFSSKEGALSFVENFKKIQL